MGRIAKLGARGGLTAVALGGLVASGVLSTSAALVAGDPLAAPAGAEAGLTRFDSCEALLAWYRSQGLRSVGAYGWDGNAPVYYAMDNAAGGVAERAPVAAAAGPGGAVGSSGTGTNTQEVGVDEPDLAKTNGSLLVRVVDTSVLLSDVTGAQPRALASYQLPQGMYGAELLLVGDRVVVTATGPQIIGGPVPLTDSGSVLRRSPIRPDQSPTSRVLVLDVSDPARPSLVSDRTFSGSVLSARQYGDTVRLVTRTEAPRLPFSYPIGGIGRGRALAKNRAVVRASTLEDWLPSVGTGSSRRRLVACDQVLHPRTPAGVGTISVVGFKVGAPDARSVVAVTAGGDTVYSSTDRLYVATTDYAFGGWGRLLSRFTGERTRPAVRTDVHEFDLSGTAASYTASGSVQGALKDRWSLDEYDGHLRLALQTGSPFATNDGAHRTGANAIVILARSGDRLVESGRVDGLGRGEEIKAVRWFDDLAVVVTFRQMDPLYTVDLSDAAHPRLTGELKIPGFSGYLHPIGNGRLLGIGVDATSQGRAIGAQVSVFDVSDLAHPRQVDRHAFASGTSLTAPDDPRRFTWVPGTDGAGVGWTQVQDWSGRESFRLARMATDASGTLSVTTRTLPGVDPWQASRVLPLPDGRALVVAGSSATTLAG